MRKSDKGSFKVNLIELSGKDPGQGALANESGKGIYYVGMNKGQINKTLDDKYNFESIAFHESRHRYDPKTLGGTVGEVEAIYQQSLQKSWANVSSDFISAEADYAVKSLQYAIDNKEANLNINLYVKKINAAFIGYGSFIYNSNNKKVTGGVNFDLNEVVINGKNLRKQ